MKKSELKSIIRECINESQLKEESYEYDALVDTVVDAAIEGLSARHLKSWDFGKDVQAVNSSTSAAGNKAIITFKTPDGVKKVEVTAKLVNK